MPSKTNLTELEIFWILQNPKNETVEQLASRIKVTANIIRKVIAQNTDTGYTKEIVKPPREGMDAGEKFARDPNKRYAFIGMTPAASEVGDVSRKSGKKVLPNYMEKMNPDK